LSPGNLQRMPWIRDNKMTTKIYKVFLPGRRFVVNSPSSAGFFSEDSSTMGGSCAGSWILMFPGFLLFIFFIFTGGGEGGALRLTAALDEEASPNFGEGESTGMGSGTRVETGTTSMGSTGFSPYPGTWETKLSKAYRESENSQSQNTSKD
jgi:hypothetical protein